MKKMLIVYYSWSNGNTKKIAEELQKATNADIARIETVAPYPSDYQTTVNQGQREIESGFCPEIKPLNISLNNYDVIAIGTPTWWYTMAPAVLTFISSQDWRNRKVIPFMTDGGWPGHVIKDIKNKCRGADIANEMEIRFDSEGGSHQVTPQEKVDKWIDSVKENL